jgi:hypothetical protein
MFLNLLNERESKNFIELSYIAMQVNGIIKESEEAVYNSYKMETGLIDYELQNKSMDELVTAFKSSTKKVKRAVIIEIAGILDADEVVDENETKWIVKLGEDLGFRDTEIRKMLRWVQDFNDLLAEGYSYINK